MIILWNDPLGGSKKMDIVQYMWLKYLTADVTMRRGFAYYSYEKSLEQEYPID